jgi:hypothetical protein
MEQKKYVILSKLFDQIMGEVIFSSKTRELDSIEYYTTNFGEDEPAYIITDGGVLFLYDDVINTIQTMMGINHKEFTEFATIKFKRKITSIL